jgi:hypothetical protein
LGEGLDKLGSGSTPLTMTQACGGSTPLTMTQAGGGSTPLTMTDLLSS